ncbi:HDOD domain-containing protein [Candidatus Saccharibacteria bacterium]|nr:HDOD domain-containing protein [Candidatus Saccharibacteria bacterium]NIW78264.1 HDOD domain-containing protein [Calditrichia bacterium]
MSIIHINKIKPGMVVADEVRDFHGRLLLAKGKTIQPDHFRVFKIWGVTEVNVLSKNDDKKETRPDFDPEQYEKIREMTQQVFRYNDLEHPAIQEIFRLSIWFRDKYKFFNKYFNVQLTEDDPTENLNQTNFEKKLDITSIKLPEVPAIVSEFNAVVSDPLSSSVDIAQVVQKSPSMTAILLKIVNSPFYGLPSKIDKISLAITLIGRREISALALGLSIFSAFDKIPQKLLDMYAFLKHSVACGIISRMLASHKGVSQTEQFFVSGLLHDIGRLIVFCNFPEDGRQILNISQTTNKLLYEIERNYFGCDHSFIARHLIQQWKLPLSLENNIFYHHNPSKALRPVPATLVHLADIITNGLGIGTSGERFVPPLDTEAWESLDLSPTSFDIVIKQAAHQFFALESMLEN